MSSKQFQARKRRVRAKISGTGKRPRLTVYRSNQNLYAQLVDDEKGKTLIGLSTQVIKKTLKDKKTLSELAGNLGEEMANQAKKLKISEVVFDRSGYKYHGKVKAVAESARKSGLKF